ncbi:MAG TPA: hypothetical protein VNR87_07425 [Flavisolibacter sp.]|nr:hypothetical protein [Flavisolibacter sp.]
MRLDENKREERPTAYPRPSETDEQLRNQPEYIDQQPNEFHDKSVSDIPAQAAEESNEPATEETSAEDEG